MAPLTEPRSTPRRDGQLVQMAVEAGATIHQGALLVFSGGAVKPAVKASNQAVAGLAEESGAVASSGADGDVRILVRRRTMARFDSVGSGAGRIGVADVGVNAFIEDDQTVTKTSTGSTVIGRILAVDDDGVWVQLP